MRSPEVQEFIGSHGSENLVVTGSAANHAVMNTVIGAARHFLYAVWVPLDGVHSSDADTYEYLMYQLSHLPPSARPRASPRSTASSCRIRVPPVGSRRPSRSCPVLPVGSATGLGTTGVAGTLGDGRGQ